ncbi:hypothetical protein BASA81_009818 [Batrachochytrium salamandrivorans]|nr:hypothetical protein BASA81_009818 [Batrachochytrium salamandrivorans]
MQKRKSAVSAEAERPIVSKPAIVVEKDEAGEEREFGGAKGAIFLFVFSHSVLYYFWISQQFYQGAVLYPGKFNESPQQFVARLVNHIQHDAAPTKYALSMYLGFLLFQLVLGFVMPGITIKGLNIPSLGGRQLDYLCNGVAGWWFTLATVFTLNYTGIFRLSEIANNFGSLMTCAILCANLFSIIIYVTGLPKQIRMSGNVIYDFFMGSSLNPRIFYLDLKLWAEIRVSWILLFLLTCSAAAKQYEDTGRITPSMYFMVTAHFLYTNACQKGEECIPQTWDIAYEKFGWMLIFWNFAGVPFLYCFQSYFILRNDVWFENPITYVGMYVVLFVAYFVWDTAMSQKSRFKSKEKYVPRWYAQPQLPFGTLENPEFIQTKTGSRLLVDGWFRYARKIYYTADFTMALLWGLSCGLQGGFLPYFYPVFFITMLTHRYFRDVARCRNKYGEDWDKYCNKVKYHFIPGVL